MSFAEITDETVEPKASRKGAGRWVSAMPTQIPFRMSRRNDLSQLPFTDRESLQTYSGRVAIYQGVRALGLGAGDTVLVPAYACGSEVDAVMRAGCAVEFYPMTPELQPDLQACREKLAGNSAIKGLFITHYFGFAQPLARLRAFADEHELLLIEDCAHGFLSADETGQPLGRTGDVAIFSYMKTLPLTDGGACVVNRDGVTLQAALSAPAMGQLIGRFLFQIEVSLKKTGGWASGLFKVLVRAPVAIVKRALGLGRKLLRSNPAPSRQSSAKLSAEMQVLRLDPARVSWTISDLARKTVERLDIGIIREKRRANYQALLEAVSQIEDVRPLFPKLPEGTCPLFFPIEVEEAVNVQAMLARMGVGTKYFWSYFHDDFPRDAFPVETKLKLSVLALPVHQDLTRADISKIASALASVMEASRAQ